jgi:RNA polymerase sigma factor (sigma-70 family)
LAGKTEQNLRKPGFFALTFGPNSDNIAGTESVSVKRVLEIRLLQVNGQLQARLVESALAGNIESFGELCTYYYPSMVAIAYSVLADHQLAEDAAQEGFAKALTNLGKLNKARKFAPWLARICRNTAVDMVRVKARQTSSDDLSQLPDARTDVPDAEIVRDAIAKLPEHERELIVLRYYNSLSYEQISAVLGVSKAAINGRLTRAKQKLAEHLNRNGFWES